MCLDRAAQAHLARVTAGRYFRKRSPDPPPFEGGKPVEPERMFGRDARLQYAIDELYKRIDARSGPPAVGGQLPDCPADSGRERSSPDLDDVGHPE